MSGPEARALNHEKMRHGVARSQQRLKHLVDPAVLVGGMSALDADQGRLQLLGVRSGAAVADLELAVLAAHRADRRDHGGGAAGEGLAQAYAARVVAPLVDRRAALADLDALLPGAR